MRSRSCTRTRMLRSVVRRSRSNTAPWSAVSCQDVPPAYCSCKSTSLMLRSASDGCGPTGSCRTAWVRATRTPATTRTNRMTIARMRRAKRSTVWHPAISIPAYHSPIMSKREMLATSLKVDLRAQDVVQMNDANGSSLGIHDDQAGDGVGLHDLQRLDGQLAGLHGLGLPRRQLARPEVDDRLRPQVSAAQVTVGDHTDQSAVLIDDRGDAQPLVRHLDDDVFHEDVGLDARHLVAAVHEIRHADQCAPAQGAAGVERREIFLSKPP